MDPAHNAGGQSQSELSSMAPMLSIIEEMQRELGELRRSKERGHGSDSEDSDDGSVSVLYRHGFYLRPLGIMDGLCIYCMAVSCIPLPSSGFHV
jgi:hypothetical protein